MNTNALRSYTAMASNGSQTGAAERMKELAASPDTAKAAKAAKEFESFFVSQMVQHMFEGVKTDSMFGGGHGEEMFRSQLIDQYGKMVAARGGLGIADSVVRSMLHQQEVKS